MKKITHATFERQLRGVFNKAMKVHGNSLTLASLENHSGVLEVTQTHVYVNHDWVEKLTQYNTEYLQSRKKI